MHKHFSNIQMDNMKPEVEQAITTERVRCANLCRASAIRYEIAADRAGRQGNVIEEAKFVEMAYDLYETRKGSKCKAVRRIAVASKARSVILFDRVIRGDLREIESC